MSLHHWPEPKWAREQRAARIHRAGHRAVTVALAACFGFLVGLLVSESRADEWTGRDKAQHAQVSALAGAISGALIEDRWAAFGVAMVPGLVKEIHDARPGGSGFSWRDLTADAVGAGIGVQAGHCIVIAQRISCMWEF